MARERAAEKYRRILLNSEQGTLEKTGHCPLEVGLLGLSPYEVISGSLGFQHAYRLFNRADGARCERLFELGDEWISLESGRPAAEFGVLAMSISYEQELLWLIRALSDLGVPLRAEDRSGYDPVVFCGGPVISCNPEPLARYADVCGIGDSELLIPAFCEAWQATLGIGRSRDKLLDTLAATPGFYVPSRYECREDSVPVPLSESIPAKVPRAVARLEGTPVHSVTVSSRAHFRSMFLVEVARGCRWRCKFCMVCRINDPYRHADVDAVAGLLDELPSSARSVGLVGANLCDHPRLGDLLELIASRGLRAGVSSLRIGSIDSDLLGQLRGCGVNSVTLAPESSSPAMLKAIGKGYDPDSLPPLVSRVAGAGFTGLKLYYMVGLPDETHKDRSMLVSQLAELAAAAGNSLKLKVSINPFVPKPHTAWQDRSMLPQGEIKRIFKALKKEIAAAAPDVEFNWQPPAESAAQAVLSLGGRDLSPAMEKAALGGQRLLDCLAGEGIKVDRLLHQREKLASGHPWKVLECEPSIQNQP